ncbi:hypothetical protein BA896_003745 [Janthinobacterium lividum]|uniref:Uncharacterized protein n=1 Tax=Janthinobacterium lividum TaxID=29581 RepID=A0A1E8PPI3_9BURK|nr:hypothetical protein BA896_003745 [Janthinobacterium lividum]
MLNAGLAWQLPNGGAEVRPAAPVFVVIHALASTLAVIEAINANECSAFQASFLQKCKHPTSVLTDRVQGGHRIHRPARRGGL